MHSELNGKSTLVCFFKTTTTTTKYKVHISFHFCSVICFLVLLVQEKYFINISSGFMLRVYLWYSSQPLMHKNSKVTMSYLTKIQTHLWTWNSHIEILVKTWDACILTKLS